MDQYRFLRSLELNPVTLRRSATLLDVSRWNISESETIVTIQSPLISLLVRTDLTKFRTDPSIELFAALEIGRIYPVEDGVTIF